MPEYPLLLEAGLLITYARLSGPKGSRLIRLAVDTGSTMTMIPPHAAMAVGVSPARARAFRETLTASGTAIVPLLEIPRLRVFERTLRRVPVACHELPLASPVDGLLGLDLLIRLKATLDPSTRRLVIPSH